MLYIILTILKIIGVIIAVILGLILLFASVLLLNPIRYRAKVNYDEDPDIEIKFSYLFHLIRGVFTYNKDGSDAKIKVAWFNIGNKAAPSSKKTRKKKRKKKNSEVAPSDNDDLFFDSTVPELKVAETEETPAPEQTSQEDNTSGTGAEPEKKKPHKKNKFKDIGNKISGIKGSLSGVVAGITDENNKESFLFVLMHFNKIIRHIHPQKHKIDVYFGTKDPALTGQITGSLAVAATVLNLRMTVYPDFEKNYIKVNSWYKGRVRLIVLGLTLLRMYRNKKLRATIKQFMK